MYKMLIAGALLFSATLSHAQSVRLISAANYQYSGTGYVQTDTVDYAYSSGRSSTMIVPLYTEPWAYDDCWYKDYYQGQWELGGHIIREYDSNNRPIKLTRMSNLLSGWDTTLILNYHYANNLVDTVYYVSLGSPNSNKRAYTYNQYGVDQIYGYEWNANTNQYVLKNRTTYEYTSGLKTMETGESFTNNAWVPSGRVKTTYIGSNPDSVLTQQWQAPFWQTMALTINTYDANNDLVEEEYFTNAFFTNLSKNLYTYDNAHHALTKTHQPWDNGQYTNNHQRVYTYTNAGYVETETVLGWTNGQFQVGNGNGKYYYYYEEFDPASVSNIQKDNELKVYPNPATNTISIQSFTEQKSVFGVTIYDATGKSVRHWNEAPTSMYQKQVDVSGLSSGNYFLRIDNRPQETVRFTIMK